VSKTLVVSPPFCASRAVMGADDGAADELEGVGIAATIG
jgi:hypothetical protein